MILASVISSIGINSILGIKVTLITLEVIVNSEFRTSYSYSIIYKLIYKNNYLIYIYRS